MNTPSSLQSTWNHQAVWSAAASRLKKDIGRIRSWVLILILLTALFETVGLQLGASHGAESPASRIPAGIGAVLAAVAALLQAWSKEGSRVASWTRARSASEALKEQTYRYLTRTGAYAREHPEDTLRETRLRILAQVRDLEPVVATIHPPHRDPPPDLDLPSYTKSRVEAQIDGYYRKRAAELAKARKHWRAVQTALLILGAALGGAVALNIVPGLAAWVAVLTTLAGALGAHIEASRFDQLAIGYRATAARLEALRDEWNDKLSRESMSQAQKDQFVDRCEDAISVENQAWMADLSGQSK